MNSSQSHEEQRKVFAELKRGFAGLLYRRARTVCSAVVPATYLPELKTATVRGG